MNSEDLAVVEALDDGTLYADPLLVANMFTYPHLADSFLLVSRDDHGNPTGYIPVGVSENEQIVSYIPAIPPTAPVCPTYTPGAQHVLQCLPTLLSGSFIYFDVDTVANFPYSFQEETASAMCVSLPVYLRYLSSSRRKDFKRKLKTASRYTIEEGSLQDVWQSWAWMQEIWEARGQYDPEHVSRVLSWLGVIEDSNRALLKIDRYMLDNQMVGVNCSVIHDFHGVTHCDDYLTWYNADIVPGLGIVSAINNLTNPRYRGARYNLGLPGFYGETFEGHEYKWHVIPQALRLTQSIMNIKVGDAVGEIRFDCV